METSTSAYLLTTIYDNVSTTLANESIANQTQGNLTDDNYAYDYEYDPYVFAGCTKIQRPPAEGALKIFENYRIADAIISAVLFVIGTVGNLLTLVVLTRPKMKMSVTTYLIGLAVWDTIYLLASFPGVSYLQFPLLDDAFACKYGAILFPYYYFIILTGQTATIWLTVAFTIDRYIGVCHPFKAKTYCTTTRAKIVVVLISVLSGLYNLSRFFEVEAMNIDYPIGYGNDSYVYDLYYNNATDLRRNQTYLTIYYSALYLAIMFALPLLALIYFNTRLVMVVYKSSKWNREHANTGGANKQKESKENNITVMLVVVVVVFIVCQMPALVYNVAFSIMGEQDITKHLEFNYLGLIRNTMGHLNSAINFFIYCLLGKKFRQEFMLIFCKKCLSKEKLQSIQGRSKAPVSASAVANIAAINRAKNRFKQNLSPKRFDDSSEPNTTSTTVSETTNNENGNAKANGHTSKEGQNNKAFVFGDEKKPTPKDDMPAPENISAVVSNHSSDNSVVNNSTNSNGQEESKDQGVTNPAFENGDDPVSPANEKENGSVAKEDDVIINVDGDLANASSEKCIMPENDKNLDSSEKQNHVPVMSNQIQANANEQLPNGNQAVVSCSDEFEDTYDIVYEHIVSDNDIFCVYKVDLNRTGLEF